jgi:hypothetical protein
MDRRRFLQHTAMATITATLSACARAGRLPLAAMVAPGAGGPTGGDAGKVWAAAAAYARWAPSPHNIQPWRLHLRSATECDVLCDPTRMLPVLDPTSAFTTIGMTMFVEYLGLAFAPLGWQMHATYVDAPLDPHAAAPTLFAQLVITPGAASPEPVSMDRELILRRQTSRLPYHGAPIETVVMEELAAVSAQHGQALHWSTDEAFVEWTIEINRRTMFRDLNDDAGRTELRKWIRPGDDDARVTQDGLSAHCLRFPGWLLRAFFDDHRKWSRGWRARTCGNMLVRGMRGTRTVAWWSGPFATPADWRSAGRALGAQWLVLTRHGIGVHPFGSVITNPEAHAELVTKLARTPQDAPLWLLARLGHSDTPPRSLRRDTAALFHSSRES